MGQPIAVFKNEEDLRDALDRAKASLAMEGVHLSPEGEATLLRAIREGRSDEEYARLVEDEVLWGKRSD